MRRIIYLLILLTIYTAGTSQSLFEGKLVDSIGNPIGAANINVYNSTGAIVAFAVSNKQGVFAIKYDFSQKKDSIIIKIIAPGYKTTSYRYNDIVFPFKIVMRQTANKLPDVVVTNSKPMIKYRSDTTFLRVDSFAQRQDRTIGDVLKRMPGIEVDANGRISYNGQNISNFYIDGDDLLADKYNLATNSITADMVKDVQVLENHQPIRALKNATYSDKVALNLDLKNKARLKLNYDVEAELGYANNPLYNGKLGLMVFKKKYKAINTFKATNSGNDLARDFTSHNLADIAKTMQYNVPSDMLGLNYPGQPNIDQQRYLFNNSTLLNLNNLIKNKKELQYKINFYHFDDQQNQQFINNTYFYLPNDTITYLQDQHIQRKVKNTQLKITLNSNKDNVYWNNILTMEGITAPATSATQLNSTYSLQNLERSNKNFSNEFNQIFTHKKRHIFELYSYVNHLVKPEFLTIYPGINNTTFNNGLPYSKLQQKLDIPSFFSNNYLDYRITNGRWINSLRIGAMMGSQRIESVTEKVALTSYPEIISDSFVNNLSWKYHKIYGKLGLDYLGSRLKIGAEISAKWNRIKYLTTTKSNPLNENLDLLVLSPSLNLRYAIGAENTLNFRYIYDNEIGTIQDAYQNYILENYLVLSRNTVPFNERRYHSTNLAISLKKTLKLLFINAGISAIQSTKNIILNTVLKNSLQIQNTIPFENTTSSYRAYTSISKFVFKLKTNISIKASAGITDWIQFQNNKDIDYTNLSYVFSGSLNPKISNKFSVSYNNSITFNKTKPKTPNFSPQVTQQFQQVAELNWFPSSQLQVSLKGEEYQISQPKLNTKNEYFFMDASILYRTQKPKIDIILSLLNLANVNEYKVINVSANNFSQNSYIIRPRSIALKAIFNL